MTHPTVRLTSSHLVPQHILGVDRTAYEPTILSIGPYHHGKEPVQVMEKEKWNCLDFILRSNCSRSLQDYLKVIARSERRARSCYSEETKMERKRFLQMLLLDGCFILVFLNGLICSSVGKPAEDERQDTRQGTSETTGNRADLNPGRKEESNFERINQQDCQASSSNDLELCEISSGRPREEQTQKQSDRELNGSSGMGGWYSCCLSHDLLLFENQFPFYIVEGIYELFAGTERETRFLAERITECMESILRHYPIAVEESDRPKQFHHLLHLCHMYFRPNQKFEQKHQGGARQHFFYRLLNFGHKTEENEQKFLQTGQIDCLESEHLLNQWRRWRRAVQYHEAGVTLKRREFDHHDRHSLLDVKFSNGIIEIPCLPIDKNTEALFRRRWRRAVQYHEAGVTLKRREFDHHDRHSLLDVKFSNGIIEIPCLPIDKNTEALFKNLIALEQTNPRYGNDLTAYVSFMSQLVTTPDDAALLVKKGIIVHMMDSDDELSSLFTRLVKQVMINPESNYYLKFLCYALEIHYQSWLK